MFTLPALPPPTRALQYVASKKRDCPVNGVTGVFMFQRSSAAGMRSAKVMAKAFRAGFHRTAHRV
jgi:hypothetical protein